ncbi:uncharacterized protein LOC144098886 isoform X2 [Amblyomma americanum]
MHAAVHVLLLPRGRAEPAGGAQAAALPRSGRDASRVADAAAREGQGGAGLRGVVPRVQPVHRTRAWERHGPVPSGLVPPQAVRHRLVHHRCGSRARSRNAAPQLPGRAGHGYGSLHQPQRQDPEPALGRWERDRQRLLRAHGQAHRRAGMVRGGTDQPQGRLRTALTRRRDATMGTSLKEHTMALVCG